MKEAPIGIQICPCIFVSVGGLLCCLIGQQFRIESDAVTDTRTWVALGVDGTDTDAVADSLCDAS